MTRSLALTAFLVPDYDEGIAFFTQVLRWQLREDIAMGAGKRWVVVAPDGPGGALLLARAASDEQRAAIGRQGAGRVWLFLHTSRFDEDLAHLRGRGVRFTETPRSEAYGRVVVFEDPWGNRWDLIEPKAAAA